MKVQIEPFLRRASVFCGMEWHLYNSEFHGIGYFNPIFLFTNGEVDVSFVNLLFQDVLFVTSLLIPCHSTEYRRFLSQAKPSCEGYKGCRFSVLLSLIQVPSSKQETSSEVPRAAVDDKLEALLESPFRRSCHSLYDFPGEMVMAQCTAALSRAL